MKFKTKQGIIYFTIFFLMLLYTLYYRAWTGAIVFGCCILLGILVIIFPTANVSDDYAEEENDDDDEEDDDVSSHTSHIKKDYLTYYGDELNFAEEDIVLVLTKHLPYYNALNDADKQKFVNRLAKFINDKTFRIHDSSGFREMPMLISATAVQLGFGLDKYLLPNFSNINIYPQEIISVTSSIRFLEGNVNGHNINISWKYFLRGFQLPDDGENVGLHEMAHAFYYQSFGPCDEKDDQFVETFNKFNSCGNEVFQKLSQSVNGIYTDYAKRNFQEFWAESVELFFEKSLELKTIYPALHQCMCEILNQDPTQRFT